MYKNKENILSELLESLKQPKTVTKLPKIAKEAYQKYQTDQKLKNQIITKTANDLTEILKRLKVCHSQLVRGNPGQLVIGSNQKITYSNNSKTSSTQIDHISQNKKLINEEKFNIIVAAVYLVFENLKNQGPKYLESLTNDALIKLVDQQSEALENEQQKILKSQSNSNFEKSNEINEIVMENLKQIAIDNGREDIADEIQDELEIDYSIDPNNSTFHDFLAKFNARRYLQHKMQSGDGFDCKFCRK